MSWQPSATLETLRLRARIVTQIREFFATRNVLEIDTPSLSLAGTTDPALTSMRTTVNALGATRLYLHTSPEFAMKRLLAAGSGDIYQICRVYRDEELGRWHEPEFTLLEWYRVGWDDLALMNEVGELLIECLGAKRIATPPMRLSYADAFSEYLGVDAWADAGAITAALKARGLEIPERIDRRGLLDLALGAVIVPKLPPDTLFYIYDYPADQAALARLKDSTPAVAARFEAFINGVELANGFAELTDPGEQRARFEAERNDQAQLGLDAPPIDENLLAALAHGLPACAGVALGLDRLVALAAGLDGIRGALSFAHRRE